MPLSTEWQRIFICEGKPHPQTNAVVYAGKDVDFWAEQLGKYLAEGRKVSVMGENAQAVVDRYMQSL